MEGLERKWWTLIAVCVGDLHAAAGHHVVNVALPDIQRELDARFDQLQWVVNAYALRLAAPCSTAGSLADLFGRVACSRSGSSSSLRLRSTCGLAEGARCSTSRARFRGSAAVNVRGLARAVANAFQDATAAWRPGSGRHARRAVAVGPLAGGATTVGSAGAGSSSSTSRSGSPRSCRAERVDESGEPRRGASAGSGPARSPLGLFLLVYGLMQGNEDGGGAR